MRTERQKSLKPILTLNQSIYSAYWPPSDPQRLTSPQWYPGTISNIHLSKLPADIKYGYIHYYSIKFDDGDSTKMVEEHLVMDRGEYELSLQLLDDNDDDCDSDDNESDSDDEEEERDEGEERRKKKKESNKKDRSGWKGVKNVCDRQSADNWAKHVGWYVATLQNENGNNTVEHTFSLLSDALRAYDANLVRLNGLVNVTDDELNLPNDWIGSRITADGKGSSKAKAATSKKLQQQQKKETAIQLKMETKRATKLSTELSKLKEEHATLTTQLSSSQSQQQPTNEEDIKLQIKTAIQKSTKRHKADIDRLKHHLNSKYETSKQLAISDTITNEQRKFREEKLQMKKELTVLHTAQLNSLRNSLDDEKSRLQKNMELNERNIEEIYKKKNLKPLLEVGDEVFAAYFEDVNDIENSKWYPGRVRSYYDVAQGKSNEEEEDGDVKMKGNNGDNMEEQQTYGPTRVYTVRYDVDGSELDEIPECYVFTKKDYLLSTEKDVMKASSPSGATVSSSSTPSAKSLQASGLRAKPKSNKKGKHPLEGFPTGWTKERIPRKSSGSDSYYYSPIEHYKFDSMVKANRFLECLKKVNGDEVLALEEFRSTNKYAKATVDERSSSPTTASSTQKKKSPATKTWKGVKNVVDESSNDTWAQLVGWYVFDNVDDGKQQIFSHLSDAIRAYDASVVRVKGDKTKRSDLNLPDDWEWLFSEDGVHEPVMMTEDEYNEALAKEVDGFVKEAESMKKKLDQTHKREKTLAVKEAIDAERKKHHALRKRWKIDSDKDKAEAVAAANKKSKEAIEAAAKENQKKIGQAMKEAKKAMHDAREREEMAVKEATVMHNLQLDKLRSQLHQQYEHDKDKALYWARVELEQKHQDQLESMQAGKASSSLANNLSVKSDEPPVPNKAASPARKKQGLHRGSENIEESPPAPPAKRTKLATAVSGEEVGAAAVKENVPLAASSSFSSTETIRKQRQPKIDQSAGESSTEENISGDHLDSVEALLQYAEKLDSEEEGSIHSAMSVDEEEKKEEKEDGVEQVKLSIIV